MRLKENFFKNKQKYKSILFFLSKMRQKNLEQNNDNNTNGSTEYSIDKIEQLLECEDIDNYNINLKEISNEEKEELNNFEVSETLLKDIETCLMQKIKKLFEEEKKEEINNTNEIKDIEENTETINNIETTENKETINNNEKLPELFDKKLPPPKPVPNFDEIPIKSGTSNFLDLLEKNLEIEKNIPQSISQNKPIRKFTPNRVKKQIEISKPQKGEIKKYKYYSDNFKNNNSFNKGDDKDDKVKLEKEKIKESKQKNKIESKKNEYVNKNNNKPDVPKNIETDMKKLDSRKKLL